MEKSKTDPTKNDIAIKEKFACANVVLLYFFQTFLHEHESGGKSGASW
jgi:hypothetical protein